MRSFVAILCALMCCAAAAGQTPGFWLTGISPGREGSQVSSISADGRVASGSSEGVGFTWTRESGRYDFGLEPGMPVLTFPMATNAEGGVIAGGMYPDITPYGGRAFRRVGSGPMVDLGVLPGTTRSLARGISGDGSVVVGGCEYSQSTEAYGQAFRWTPQGGMQGLGYALPFGSYSVARAVSRDGTTIVGQSQSGGTGNHTDAFVWREGAGMQALPGLPGSDSWTSASAVSADGSVIVGQAETTSNLLHAVRWTASGIQDLGVPPGYLQSLALAVNDDGSVIGGRLSNDNAFVWTSSTGILPLSSYLAAAGVSVPPGIKLASVLAISADGRTFAGFAINLQTSVQEGFVATIPAPASGVVLLLLPALRRRRTPAA